jgi:hypothetical protein
MRPLGALDEQSGTNASGIGTEERPSRPQLLAIPSLRIATFCADSPYRSALATAGVFPGKCSIAATRLMTVRWY